MPGKPNVIASRGYLTVKLFNGVDSPLLQICTTLLWGVFKQRDRAEHWYLMSSHFSKSDLDPADVAVLL